MKELRFEIENNKIISLALRGLSLCVLGHNWHLYFLSFYTKYRRYMLADGFLYRSRVDFKFEW